MRFPKFPTALGRLNNLFREKNPKGDGATSLQRHKYRKIGRHGEKTHDFRTREYKIH